MTWCPSFPQQETRFSQSLKAQPKVADSDKEAIRVLLQDGIIHPSKSPWASQMHVVLKKSGWRVVSDYSHLNDIICKDAYSMPHHQDFSAKLAGCSFHFKCQLDHRLFPDPSWRGHYCKKPCDYTKWLLRVHSHAVRSLWCDADIYTFPRHSTTRHACRKTRGSLIQIGSGARLLRSYNIIIWQDCDWSRVFSNLTFSWFTWWAWWRVMIIRPHI